MPFVADSLIFHYHAGLADRLTYGKNSPQTTVWKDVLGINNDGALTGFAFDATTGWVGDDTSPSPSRLKLAGGSRVKINTLPALKTVEVAFKSSLASDNSVFSRNWTTNTNKWALGLNLSGVTLQVHNGTSWSSITGYTLNEVCVVTMVNTTGTNVAFYKNGVYITTVSVPGFNVAAAEVYLGSLQEASYPMTGEIYYFRGYSRALTPEEVAQNYANGILYHTEYTTQPQEIALPPFDTSGRRGITKVTVEDSSQLPTLITVTEDLTQLSTLGTGKVYESLPMFPRGSSYKVGI